MNQGEYNRIEGYMISAMRDSAHDVEHVRRVLRGALAIAAAHPDADPDVLTAACLLHDVGRQAQFDDPKIDHAAEGARMARAFLFEGAVMDGDAHGDQGRLHGGDFVGHGLFRNDLDAIALCARRVADDEDLVGKVARHDTLKAAWVKGRNGEPVRA